MAKKQKLPTNLLEAVRYFSDVDVATEFVAKLRWPQGPFCPSCGCVEHSYLKTRRLWKCKACKRQYSVKVGTVFEESRLGLDKWLPAVWLTANSKNGISSHELGRALGITQKSAWFMLHRIRLAMQSGTFDSGAYEKLEGEVEIDETWIGGKVTNMHRTARERRGIPETGYADEKTTVVGSRQRGGRVRAEVVPDRTRKHLVTHALLNVERGSTVYTDKWRSYIDLDRFYDHEIIDHAEAYVRGTIHTNGIENFWSLLKRAIKGTYVSVEPFHLFRYLDERMFTYNLRGLTDLGRFSAVLAAVTGLRLTYAELTGAD
jgi:transposase-like protein